MNTAPVEKRTLENRTIAVPESRELDVFAAMLERRGATVLRCPMISIKNAPDPAPVLEWIRKFNQGACDDLILLTGEGLRRLLSCMEQNAPQLRDPFIARLAQARKITRGPKPARALRELGLKPDIAAQTPTTEGVIAELRSLPLAGRTVGVQLYGTEPNLPLIEFLRDAGARVLTVAPYVYADAVDDQAILELLAALDAGKVHAIAFTSTPQVARLFAVADVQRIQRALANTLVAAVGPVVAATLSDHGIAVQLMPEDSFFMKPLTTALEQALA